MKNVHSNGYLNPRLHMARRTSQAGDFRYSRIPMYQALDQQCPRFTSAPLAYWCPEGFLEYMYVHGSAK
jgi:hypothetical protein